MFHPVLLRVIILPNSYQQRVANRDYLLPKISLRTLMFPEHRHLKRYLLRLKNPNWWLAAVRDTKLNLSQVPIILKKWKHNLMRSFKTVSAKKDPDQLITLDHLRGRNWKRKTWTSKWSDRVLKKKSHWLLRVSRLNSKTIMKHLPSQVWRELLNSNHCYSIWMWEKTQQR
jgi:hypothetical protein